MAVPISETTIQHHATSNSCDRGKDYYQRGTVTNLVQRGDTIYADDAISRALTSQQTDWLLG